MPGNLFQYTLALTRHTMMRYMRTSILRVLRLFLKYYITMPVQAFCSLINFCPPVKHQRFLMSFSELTGIYRSASLQKQSKFGRGDRLITKRMCGIAHKPMRTYLIYLSSFIID